MGPCLQESGWGLMGMTLWFPEVGMGSSFLNKMSPNWSVAMTSVVLQTLARGIRKIEKGPVVPLDVSSPWEAVQIHL